MNDKWQSALEKFDEIKSRTLDEKVEYSLKLIERAVKEHEKYCVACSFGKDSTVMLHLVRQIDPDVLVVFSNTGVEMKETLKFRDFLVKEWNLNYVELKPEKTFWECVKEYGYPQFRYLSREKKKLIEEGKIQNKGTPKCCYYLKEKPAFDFYRKKGIEAVFVGLTWDESYQRRWRVIRFGDHYHSKRKGYWTVLPLAYWNTKDVWTYIEQNDLPVNRAYDKVDRVGCITCTGYIGWKEQMARLYPGLYRKIATDLGFPPLTAFELGRGVK